MTGEHNLGTSGVGSMVSKVESLSSYQHKTHTSLLSNFSAHGTAVVVSVKIHTYTVQTTVLPWASPAVGSAHGAPQAVEEGAAQATTHGDSNGTDVRDTDPWIQGLGVLAASTPLARTQTTRILHHFGLMLFFIIHFSAVGKRKEGQGPNWVFCCLTSTCAIRQRQRGQVDFEGAMVRTTRQTGTPQGSAVPWVCR